MTRTPTSQPVIRPVRSLGSNMVHLAPVAPSDIVEGVSFNHPYHGIGNPETLCHALLKPFRGAPTVLMQEGTRVTCARCRRSIG